MFGAIAHVGRHYQKTPQSFTKIDIAVLFTTANFSGLVFGLIALLIGDNQLHLYLAVSTGSFLGLAGLSRITDIIISVIAKR